MTQAASNVLTPGPIQSDLMLWSMLRTRRRRLETLNGLDAVANRWIGRARHARVNVRYLRREAEAVDALSPRCEAMSDAELDDHMARVRAVFQRRRQQRDHVREALAIIREAARRTTGERPYIVQLMGALGLYHGQIVEMVTGEGKTLTAAVSATLLAWTGRPVHLYTTNDYLAQRDAAGRNPIYRRCGLRAEAIVGENTPQERAAIYQAPIVYAAPREIMGDWLRDRLRLGRVLDPVSMRWLYSPIWRMSDDASSQPLTLVPGLFAAIVDEIDAILIDEAVTPLIIAQRSGENEHAAIYIQARDIANQLQMPTHYTVSAADRRVQLTAAGRQFVNHLLESNPSGASHPIWRAVRRRLELVEQALVARHCYEQGRQYQIIDNQVVIVDEYTGRIQPERQWQNGLHQAVQAKHNLEITADQQTLASISFQRFFQQYPHLCGMTGTAAEARPEMERTYGRPVRVIPTHRPIQRVQWPDRIFARAADKWQAIVDEVERLHRDGRPILIGTRSVEASEHLSELLTQRRLNHEVLNAVRHKEEAAIVEKAGHYRAITVATNMAGRGTDIKLGPGVRELGGLHVILTERHTARRVDRQFIGRSGRQGDVGSAQIFMSLEDDLLVRYLPRISALLRQRYANQRGELPRYLSRVFAYAQRKATRQAMVTRLMMIRHDHELERMLPG